MPDMAGHLAVQPAFRVRMAVGVDRLGDALEAPRRERRAGELDGQRVAEAVLGLAGADPDPALADAVLLDVGLFLAVEADADIAPEDVLVIVRAPRVDGEAVGKGVGHSGILW